MAFLYYFVGALSIAAAGALVYSAGERGSYGPVDQALTAVCVIAGFALMWLTWSDKSRKPGEPRRNPRQDRIEPAL